MSKPVEQLRLAIVAFDKEDLNEAVVVLEQSKEPIDRENAPNCRKLASVRQAERPATL
jgi:hypothetical protein